jgi:hypothetical protein
MSATMPENASDIDWLYKETRFLRESLFLVQADKETGFLCEIFVLLQDTDKDTRSALAP